MLTPTDSDRDASLGTEKINCYHCGLPVPEGQQFVVKIHGQPQPMCCPGCQAVAQAIVEGGLADYYRFRTENAATGAELVPEFLRDTRIYDNPTVQRTFVESVEEGFLEASLVLEGVTCAACIWLNEQHLKALPGVVDAQVNFSTQRARVKWDPAQVHLSDILQAIARIGYRAYPYDPVRQERMLEQERKRQLRRLGVAGVLGMQVMMLAVALYAGEWSGMAAQYRRFFHWVSLLLTTPVVLYSAAPFFQAAWRDLKGWQAGMDVPVSLGITLAFAGSLWATTTGRGDVYYDSVVMFVFFLLVARYLEFLARRRSAQLTETLVHSVPAMATRLSGPGSTEAETEELVPVADLRPGDRVLVRPGETVPADGRLSVGRSTIDESLLTGESRPLMRAVGDAVIGGSINIESPIEMEVTRTGQETVLSQVFRLVERAQTSRPDVSRMADRVAGYFVLAVLGFAAGVGLYWWHADPGTWLPVTVAVLVVTCPCALSLATPTALTAATGAMIRLGLIPTRGQAVERLATANHFVFDKTGTLTRGRLTLVQVKTLSQMTEEQCLALAVGLEKRSEHPIARAFLDAWGGRPVPDALNTRNVPGAGMMGIVDETQYFLGNSDYIRQRAMLAPGYPIPGELEASHRTVVILAEPGKMHATFFLEDQIREDAEGLITALTQDGTPVSLLSGDHAEAVRSVAEVVGIKDYGADLRPSDKLQRLESLQTSGAAVVMVGDGINDAPVLSAAQASIAMAAGTQAARASSDLILMSERLLNLWRGTRVARRAVAVIRQNLIWAVGYNVLALPAAAAGFIAPWMAAIGMSASSLLVVANSLRLARNSPDRQHP